MCVCGGGAVTAELQLIAETVDSGVAAVPAIKQSLSKLFHFLSYQMLGNNEHDKSLKENSMKMIHCILYFLYSKLLEQKL